MQFDSFWRELKPRLNRSSVVNDKSADARWGRLVYMLLYLASSTRCEWNCQSELLHNVCEWSALELNERCQIVWSDLRFFRCEDVKTCENQSERNWLRQHDILNELKRRKRETIAWCRNKSQFSFLVDSRMISASLILKRQKLIESEVACKSLNFQLLKRLYCSIKSEIVKPFYRQFRFYRWRTLAQQKKWDLKGK